MQPMPPGIMGNMSYCRHENTANDLQNVVENWHDYDETTANSYERRGRERIINLAREILELEGEL